MANKCIVCSDLRRVKIDRAIVEQGNLAKIAETFDISYNSLYQHSKNHVSRQMSQAISTLQAEQSFDLVTRIDSIVNRCEDIFNRNYEAGLDLVALKSLDSQRATLELLAKISYNLSQSKQAEADLNARQITYHDVTCQSEESVHFYHVMKKALTQEEQDLFRKLTIKVFGAM